MCNKRTDILNVTDVKRGELILALLFRPHGKAEAHLIKFGTGGRGRKGAMKVLKDFWPEILETFLHHIGGK